MFMYVVTCVYRRVCTVRGICECVYICIQGPEVGVMGFSWLLSTLFIETESLNWSQSSLVLAGFTNQLASGTLSLPRKCWVYRQATCLRGTSMGSGDLPSRSSAHTAVLYLLSHLPNLILFSIAGIFFPEVFIIFAKIGGGDLKTCSIQIIS